MAFANSNISIINTFDFTLPNVSYFCVSFGIVGVFLRFLSATNDDTEALMLKIGLQIRTQKRLEQ